MNRSTVEGLLFGAAIMLLNAGAHAEAQFGIPVTFTNGTNTTVVIFGVSGDGPGGTINDNTRGIDIDTMLFSQPYLEVELPPAPPVPVWEVRFAALPGDPSLGTGLAASYYGFTSAVQVDNYLIDLFGSAVSGAITISWPANISDYATACVLQGNLFDPGIGVVNMLTSTSVVAANGILLGAADVKITKTGAFAPPTGPGCSDIFFFNAKCNMNGAAQAMVKMTGDWTGETVTFDLDGDDYVSIVSSNGTNSIAKMTVPHAGMGSHTVTLENPAGCYSPVTFNCQVDAPPDPEWDALWAEYDAMEQASALKVIPTETRIIGNYPNPFNPSTTIRYALSVDSPVSVRVYNMLGQEVATLVDGFQKAGEQSVVWHGVNNFGQSIASGLYIYRLQAGNTIMSQKMLFTK